MRPKSLYLKHLLAAKKAGKLDLEIEAQPGQCSFVVCGGKAETDLGMCMECDQTWAAAVGNLLDNALGT